MKKLIYLCVLAIGFTSCSVESLDSTENLIVADAKMKIQQVEKSMNLKAVEICEGESPVFVFTFPQAFNGPNPTDTDIRIQIETTPGSGDWINVTTLEYSGEGPEEYTLGGDPLPVGTYSYRAQIEGGNPNDHTAILNVIKCTDCEESFNYVENEDGSYTFTYIPEEDMKGVDVVFTFAQSVVASGYDWPNWNGNSSTRTETMDLDACGVYTWTVFLTGDCSGNSGKSNLWTDFKVDNISKKGTATPNIEQDCLK